MRIGSTPTKIAAETRTAHGCCDPSAGLGPHAGNYAESAVHEKRGRRPRQPHPGTRITHYRCFLPDLAGFASYRRGGTDGATIDCAVKTSREGHDVLDYRKTGGESGIRTREAVLSRLHTFQACSFNHSDTSPQTFTPSGIVRPILGLTLASLGPAFGCPNSFQTNLSNPRSGLTRLHTFQAAPSTTRTPLRKRLKVRFRSPALRVAENTRRISCVQAKRRPRPPHLPRLLQSGSRLRISHVVSGPSAQMASAPLFRTRRAGARRACARACAR